MIEQSESPAAPQTTYTPPPLRTFKVAYTDERPDAIISAHHYDATTGHLIFIEQAWDERLQKIMLYYRRTIAAGQWREIEEICVGTAPLVSRAVN
jgi:hypothetical protein